MKTLLACEIGRTRYADVLKLQQQLFVSRQKKNVSDILILTEHEQVYTLGTEADRNNLLATQAELVDRHIETFDADRDGDIEYHGPGQLVGYSIVDLNVHYRDARRYVSDIEDTLIRSLSDLGILGTRYPDYDGVWVNGQKIASIGVKINRWITTHGFALNVSTDLSNYDRIVPGGIFNTGVTSIEKILGRKIVLSYVAGIIASRFSEVFNSSLHWITPEELNEYIGEEKGAAMSPLR